MPSVSVAVANQDGQTALAEFDYLPPVVLPPTDHPYFDALTQDPAYWKGYSLRPQPDQPITSPHYGKQLLGSALGGYAQGALAYDITYDPAHDYDPQAQDAAKVMIVSWGRTTWALEEPLSATDTVLRASWIGNTGWKNHSLKFPGGEIAKVVGFTRVQTGTAPVLVRDAAGHLVPKIDEAGLPVTSPVYRYDLTLVRGTFGTTAAAYPVGTTLLKNTASLENNVDLPLGTVDGNSYLFTYDFFCTDSCVNAAPHDFPIKSFQLKSSYGIWLEQRIVGRLQSTTQVGAFNVRSYNVPNTQPAWKDNMVGPNVKKTDPLSPQVTPVMLWPGRWYRVWMAIEQRANDYDLLSTWIADAANVYPLHDRLQIAVRSRGITSWYIEFNSSNDALYDERVKVLYTRNVAALRWAGAGVPAAPYLLTEGL